MTGWRRSIPESVLTMLHAGDAYFFHGQLKARPRMPLALGYFQRTADLDRNMRMANQERLRQLAPFYFAWGCFRDFVSGPCGVPPKSICTA